MVKENKNWVTQLGIAAGTYLANQDREYAGGWRTKPTALAEHFKTCTVIEGKNVTQDARTFGLHEEYGGGTEAVIFLGVTITCTCGEYTNKYLNGEGNIQILL
jgi:hypothetical protein